MSTTKLSSVNGSIVLSSLALVVSLIASMPEATHIQADNGATQVHRYDLNGSLTDIYGGPSLVSNGGTLTSTDYVFGVSQGLHLDGALVDPTDYSVEVVMKYDALAPRWKKIIDFQSLSSDYGVYLQYDWLDWVPATDRGPGAVAENSTFHLALSRSSSSGETKGYLNGQLQWTFTGRMGATAVPSSNVLIFFEDDFAEAQVEAQSGSTDCIAIYDGVLTASEISVLAANRQCSTSRQVSIDIRPDSNQNSVNPASRGTIPVAIFSESTFDAPSLIDRTSLTFGRTGNENSVQEPSRSGVKGLPKCDVQDVNVDGKPDLMCHFETQRTGLQVGDVVAFLKGKTKDGVEIFGQDVVRTN